MFCIKKIICRNSMASEIIAEEENLRKALTTLKDLRLEYPKDILFLVQKNASTKCGELNELF